MYFSVTEFRTYFPRYMNQDWDDVFSDRSDLDADSSSNESYRAEVEEHKKRMQEDKRYLVMISEALSTLETEEFFGAHRSVPGALKRTAFFSSSSS